ncbi:hypothetical protein BNJ_00215 [Kaumoebavirus]|uniref:hypothetical protein n=1 Tax=Kaumoebavirus TaxID=1859492 RepID=UPI0009C3E019|nr:hypothetical protein BNJ_00215 [Kaumoebavirus]ARA72044.1 hypothetical protein BNJ_00215 [Kaumoebavirus]
MNRQFFPSNTNQAPGLTPIIPKTLVPGPPSPTLYSGPLSGGPKAISSIVPPLHIPPKETFVKKVEPASYPSSYAGGYDTPRSDSERSLSMSSYYDSTDPSFSDSGREKFRDSREGSVQFGVQPKPKLRVDPNGLKLLEQNFYPPGKIFNATGRDMYVRFSIVEDGIERKIVAKVPAEWGSPYDCRVNQYDSQGSIVEHQERREGNVPCKSFVLNHKYKKTSPRYKIYNVLCNDGVVRPYDAELEEYVEKLPQAQIPGYNSLLDRLTAYPLFPESKESAMIIILVNKVTAGHLRGLTSSQRFITEVGHEKFGSNEVVYDIDLVVGTIWSGAVYLDQPRRMPINNMAELENAVYALRI